MGEADECWPFTGSITASGYGRFRSRSKIFYAHRFAYQIANGIVITVKKDVVHSCGNRLCCNPKHLVQTKKRVKIKSNIAV